MNLLNEINFIEHIVEPKTLLLLWRSFVVAEMNCIENKITLTYLSQTNDFQEAQKQGFESYVAFPDTSKIYSDVLDTFMRRVPPRTRRDFSDYLKNFRIKPDAIFSSFALLGYTGAKLPSDNFSIFHPFYQANTPCELLIDVAKYQEIQKENININIPISEIASFQKTIDDKNISVHVKERLIGYVPNPLLPTFLSWMHKNQIANAWVEKKNGQPGKTTIYIYVEIKDGKN